jgi:hypothetical protein
VSYEFGGVYAEGFGELANSTEMRLSMVALDVSNCTRTNARLLRQLLLREKPSSADLSQPISDVDHGGHCSLLLLADIE